MPQLFGPTLAEMIAELERELLRRRRVYPVKVAAGRMRPWAAERQIETLAAVVVLLREGSVRETERARKLQNA